MEEEMKGLNDYLEGLKKSGGKVPSRARRAQPNLKVISAATRIGYRHLFKPPFKQRIELAVGEIGLERTRATVKDFRATFERNCKLIDSYLRLLEAEGHKLPEDPKRAGQVLFEQAEIESGVSCEALTFRGIKKEGSNTEYLRKIITDTAPRIGLEVRILPQCLKYNATPITYERLLEKGTSERTGQLNDKGSLRQQLYNTRYALNQFLREMKLEKSAAVGQEFTTDFGNNIENITGRLKNNSSRKKFQTEIHWWQDFYQRLLKEQSLPNEFHKAIYYLADTSGLSPRLVAKLIGIANTTFIKWGQGTQTPSHHSLPAVSRAESLFKLPAGTLVNKISRTSSYGRFKVSKLPDFLKETPRLAQQIKKYLPDDFCELTTERQREIVDTIYSGIAGDANPFVQKQIVLQRLPYRLVAWPKRLEKEFEDLAAFKMGERSPLGMERIGTWAPATKDLVRKLLGYLFGSICLPSDAEDIRLRGLGVPQKHLSLALLVCPDLVDWHIRWRCENRCSYTHQATRVIQGYLSMVRAKTGWLRQHPELASRLRPISSATMELVSSELIAEALSDWDIVCDKAVSKYEHLISEVEDLADVARNPFHPIEGILKLNDPMESFERLIEGMRNDMPNRNTEPTHYHGAVRNRALVVLLAATGLRRRTLSELNYTGNDSGHLYLKDGAWVLSIPRALFKCSDSAYFGPKRSRSDYYMNLPDVYGLAEILSEYLNTSRPYLLNKYYSGCKEQPLFVNSYQGKSPRLAPGGISRIYFDTTEKYIAEKEFRGTGIPGAHKYGPHAVRHIRAVTVLFNTESFEIAADANQHSVQMAREHYARFLPENRNDRVNKVLFKKRKDEEKRKDEK